MGADKNVNNRDKSSFAILAPSIFVQPSSLFSIPHLLFSPAPTSSLTSKMDCDHSDVYWSSKKLSTQSTFDHIFGLHPTMIHIIPRNQQ